MKVMIVDDMKINGNLLEFHVSTYFKDIGLERFDIDVFDSSEEAYEVVTREGGTPYNLVFLDIMMPMIDGLELLTLIRHDLSLIQPHIIMTTSLDDEEIRFEENDLGADGSILKPYDKDAIIKILDKFCKQ